LYLLNKARVEELESQLTKLKNEIKNKSINNNIFSQNQNNNPSSLQSSENFVIFLRK
jgi:hypothetical protein